MLRRIGLRGLGPALVERPQRGFVLPFERGIRRGLKDAMDQTLRDPQAIAPAGLDPAAVERLWRAFLGDAPGMYWSRVWSVYIFIRWCHRNRVFR
jgi:asparagine synthase (glutamine-hydrolysing)